MTSIRKSFSLSSLLATAGNFASELSAFLALVILKKLEVLDQLPCYQIQSFRGVTIMVISLAVICCQSSDHRYNLTRADYKNIFWMNIASFITSGLILHASLCMSLSVTVSLYMTYPVVSKFLICYEQKKSVRGRDYLAIFVFLLSVIFVFIKDSLSGMSHSDDSNHEGATSMNEMGRGAYFLPLIAAVAAAHLQVAEEKHSEKCYPPVVSALGVGVLFGCVSPPISMGYQGSKLFDLRAIILCGIAGILSWLAIIIRGNTKNTYGNTDVIGITGATTIPLAFLIDIYYFQTGFSLADCILATLVLFSVALLSPEKTRKIKSTASKGDEDLLSMSA